MNEDFSNLRSPISGSKLSVENGNLVSDTRETFPIVSGIPRFVGAENYASDFGRQWNHFRRTQLDSHTGLSLSKDRLARCFCGELPQVKGKRVLEAGSGAGRFTEILLDHGAKLDTFDYSSAVEANAANNGTRSMTLVQADIREMPFEPESYDYAVCLGALQHTPNTEESIGKLWKMVRPGGAVILDHYRLTRWSFPAPIGGGGYFRRKKFLRLPRGKVECCQAIRGSLVPDLLAPPRQQVDAQSPGEDWRNQLLLSFPATRFQAGSLRMVFARHT